MNITTERELTDTELASRAGSGDEAAFAEIVRRHDASLRRLARGLVGSAWATDDVMQEAYLRAFRALPRFRGDASLGTWLYRITRNASVDHLRRQRVVEVQPAEDDPEPVWPGPDPADVVTTRRIVADAFGTLTADQRAVARLVDSDGLNYSEAATILRLAPGTVASRLSRARCQLRRSIEAASRDAA